MGALVNEEPAMDVRNTAAATLDHQISSSRMKTLFREMDERATELGGKIEMTVIGAARMELVNPGERPATTIDVLYDSTKLADAALRNEIAAQMTIESKGEISQTWLNDCASWLAKPEALAPDPRTATVYEGESLTVHAASAERMLMMKIDKIDDLTAAAGRAEEPSAKRRINDEIADDVHDITLLAEELDASSIEEITRDYNREKGRAADAPLQAATLEHIESVMPHFEYLPEIDADRPPAAPETDPVAELREIDIAAEAVWRQRTVAIARSREDDYRFDDALRVNEIPEFEPVTPDADMLVTDRDEIEIPSNPEIDEMIRQAGATAPKTGERAGAQAETERSPATPAPQSADACAYERSDRETAPQRPSARTARPSPAMPPGRDQNPGRGSAAGRV